MKKLITLFFLASFSLCYAQPNLLPNIGIGPLPADSEPICDIPWYLGSFYDSGLQAGDTAYDFTLYDLNGDSLNLKTALSKGRPVLLIASSYTCPVYRGKVPAINSVVSTYAGQLDVYIIYTVEAHPVTDTSIYFGYVNTTTANNQEGILYRQPTTYGERKTILSDMLNAMPTQTPVFLDGPCNNWWRVYGPAPNNAYLIDTSGVIFAKHGWFNRYPDKIFCDIDSLLGTTSGSCTTSGGGSNNYTFQMTSSDTIYEPLGTTISVDAELTNPGTQDITIYARRILNDIPSDWGSSMCIDVCYSPFTDSTVFVLPAGSTQAVHVYFYTSATSPDTGHVKMGFRNMNNSANSNTFHVFGISEFPLGLNEISQGRSFTIYPNPASTEVNINVNSSTNYEVQLFNRFGELVLETENKQRFDVSGLASGVYFVRVKQGNYMTFKKLVKL